MDANVSAEMGLDASTPLTSAPSASPIFVTLTADIDSSRALKILLRSSREDHDEERIDHRRDARMAARRQRQRRGDQGGVHPGDAGGLSRAGGAIREGVGP